MPTDIHVDRGDWGVRIDRVLMRHLAGEVSSRNRIQQLVRSGAVTINGTPVPRSSARVASGDLVNVALPERKARRRPAPESLPIQIVYEDDQLLILNKPAGQVVHPAYRNPGGTLLNAVLHHCSDARPVNRLDRFTSGLVVFSKTVDVHTKIQRAIGDVRAQKDYLAVVHGRPKPVRGTIDLALARDWRDRRLVIVSEKNGKPSVTRYVTLHTSTDRRLSLLQCQLVTGRTHQIRVHLSARGWPIVGDPVYGVGHDQFPRQALHAWRLEFDHPTTRHRTTVTAPIPSDLQTLLDANALA